jgi:hypothetical protein
VGQKVHSKSRGLYFFYGKGKDNHQLGAGYFVQQIREWGLFMIGCHTFGFQRSLL